MRSTLPDPHEQLVLARPIEIVGRRRALLHRFWVRLRRRWLDFLIAHGADPLDSLTLQLRVHQLTDRRVREKLGRRIERVVLSVDRTRRWSPFVRPEPACVAAARAELRTIAEILRDGSLVYVRGVAMTAALVTDPESPLFDPREAVSAWYWAQMAARALEGHV
jgi:hypothetical protein